MLTYSRRLRLKNLEIFMIFKNNISLGYLIIEDLRRALDIKDIGTIFEYMTEEDLDTYKNIIKVDIVSDEILLEEDKKFIEIFADGLIDCKDYCATFYNYKINAELFEQLGLTEDIPFYQQLLSLINSKYNISNLDFNKLMFLSQD